MFNLDEIPDDFNIKIKKFMTEELPIKSELIVDTEGLGSPTLHEVLQEAFFVCITRSVNYWIHIFSCIYEEWHVCVFLFSFPWQNGLTSSDGASCMIIFSSFDDIVKVYVCIL